MPQDLREISIALFVCWHGNKQFEVMHLTLYLSEMFSPLAPVGTEWCLTLSLLSTAQ